MKTPNISVVMPVYNAEKYLECAIASILDQTYTNFEFIIINDGSSDSSLSIIEKFAQIDDRIIIISRENRGLIASLNEGFQRARGKYIARMDADDISLPKRFQEQFQFLEDNPHIGVCGCWVKVFKDDGSEVSWKLPVGSKELKTRLLFSVPVAHPSVMIRKSVLSHMDGLYKSAYSTAEDYAFWVELSNYTEFSNLPKILFKYRYLNSSISRVADNADDDGRYNVIKSIFVKVLDELKIKNTDKENRLHFIIASNERIAKTNIGIFQLKRYFSKILKKNDSEQVFDSGCLLKFLCRKYLIAFFYQLKKGNLTFLCGIFSKYFLMGFFFLVQGWLQKR